MATRLHTPLSCSALLLGALLACKSTDGDAKKVCAEEFQHMKGTTGWTDEKQCATVYTDLKKQNPTQFACIKDCTSKLQGPGAPDDPLNSPSVKYMTCKSACANGTGTPAGTGQAELGAPDVEISPEDLVKEYAKDADATLKKYQGKTLKLRGKIDSVSVYDDKNTAYVTLVGAFYRDPGVFMRVSCVTVPSSYAKFMEPKVKSIGSDKLFGTIQGKFSKVYPKSNSPAIELEPCTYIEPKQ